MTVYFRSDSRQVLIDVDLSDYLDEVTSAKLDTGDTPLIVDDLKDARRCLLRPQPSPAEALCYLERALAKMARQGFP